MAHSKWNAGERLNEFIFDYLIKKNLHESARAFMREAKVSTDPVASEVEGGLYEWWSVFWDVFISHYTKYCNEKAADYLEIQGLKRQVLLLQSSHQQKNVTQQGITHRSLDGAANLVKPENLIQQSVANVMPTKHHEEHRKQLQQGEGFEGPSKKKIGDSLAQLLEANKAVHYKNALPSGPLVWKTGGNLSRPVQQCQVWPQSLPGNSQESLEMDFSAHGGSGFRPFTYETSNHGSNNAVPLEGWMLTDQTIPSLRQRQSPFSSTIQQHQNLSWQQQQTLLQANRSTALTEVQSLPRTIAVHCCHFSYNGMWLAIGGYDKRALLWNVNTLEHKSTLELHNALISDVRFSPDSAHLATSSYDSLVRVWDADNTRNLIRSFDRHCNLVNSVDFNPRNGDILCSCSEDGEIFYWSVKKGSIIGVSKGAKTQLRFQPKDGQYLAAVADNAVVLLDIEKNISVDSLQEYEKPVRSICWDDSGKYIASLTEDQARILSVREGGKCIREFKSTDNMFQACVFHPKHPSLLIIGCGKNLVLWNVSLNKIMEVQAHSDFISALAKSSETGIIASASLDLHVKLWK